MVVAVRRWGFSLCVWILGNIPRVSRSLFCMGSLTLVYRELVILMLEVRIEFVEHVNCARPSV